MTFMNEDFLPHKTTARSILGSQLHQHKWNIDHRVTFIFPTDSQ